MNKQQRYELLIDMIAGCIFIGILVNLTSNNIEQSVQELIKKYFPNISYTFVLTFFLIVILCVYLSLKNYIIKQIQIKDFEFLNTTAKNSDTRKYLINALKQGEIGDESLKALLDSTPPNELLPFIKFIGLKIGKKTSLRLAANFFSVGKYHQNYTHNIQLSKDYLELATELCPENPKYPNEAGILCMSLKEYNQARDFFLTAMMLFNSKSDKVNVATTQNNLGNCFLRWNKFEEALYYFDTARETHFKIFKSVTVDIIVGSINIASVFWKNHQFQEAIRILLQAQAQLEIVEISGSPENQQRQKNYLDTLSGEIPRKICEVNLDLSKEYKDEEILKSALHYATDALNIDLSNWGDNNERTALSYNVIGKVYDELNETKKALSAYKSAYSELSKIQLDNHEPLIHCSKRIKEIEKQSS